MFKFTNWHEIRPEDREQRVLDERRVPEIKNYILENEDDYLFAAITASYKSAAGVRGRLPTRPVTATWASSS